VGTRDELAHESPGDKLTNDHWVSQGYQANFATPDRRLAILNVHTGSLAPKTRAIRRNFCEKGFTTYLDDGKRNDRLENAFAGLETTVLDRVRKVSPADRGPDLKIEVVHLFAIHLVRNPSFKAFHKSIAADVRARDVPAIAAEPDLPVWFEREFGRPPNDGELLDLTRAQYDALHGRPDTVLGSMAQQHDGIAEKLNRLNMQVVSIEPALPGFAVGDIPIVHAHPATNRYGFRDHLALMDASFVFGPLSRRVGVCFSSKALPPFRVKTRRMLDTLNGLTIRTALNEVACHPDDAKAVRQAHQRLDRLPPSFLFER
jgi:hypothetical protein